MDCNENQFGQWNRASEDVLSSRYPIHRCCRDGDMENLSLFIITGQQSLLVEDEFYGWTPAHWAAYFGQLACLRKIMQVLNMEPSSSRYQQTPAHIAAFAGHPHCLQWLLRTGSDPHAKDYLGETPVHKAARTGSMECISLMAADNCDLNAVNNCNQAPSAVASKCGYIDCALYLQRAADQQQLQRSGVIESLMLPILQTQSVLPGQKPDKCLITQGLNGGRLPNSIDSHHLPLSNGMEIESHNGHTPHQYNGLNTNNYYTSRVRDSECNLNGNGELNGHNLPMAASAVQKDVLLSEQVAKNRVPVAGRKRCREEIADNDHDLDYFKKIKRLQSGGDASLPEAIGNPNWNPLIGNGVPPKNTSTEEHHDYMIAQQGYDSMLIDMILLECHGS